MFSSMKPKVLLLSPRHQNICRVQKGQWIGKAAPAIGTVVGIDTDSKMQMGTRADSGVAGKTNQHPALHYLSRLNGKPLHVGIERFTPGMLQFDIEAISARIIADFDHPRQIGGQQTGMGGQGKV